MNDFTVNIVDLLMLDVPDDERSKLIGLRRNVIDLLVRNEWKGREKDPSRIPVLDNTLDFGKDTSETAAL